ncbi:pilus assembly PilX family protein [Undibacterium sp. Ren11W]|uniref:pilus assembly PilX family protein n=1 Tax=Undibacterium sp. Ren11W TaxID=3413045 RepID=UPI003BF0D41A
MRFMSVMCHKPSFSVAPSSVKTAAVCNSKQRGFSLISAIFLLVVLTALGVFMLSMSTMQQTTSTQDMQGSKAYQAAKAGIEWGAYQILTPVNLTACPGVTVLPTLGGALAGFAVTVSCSSADFVEGGNTVRVYQLTSSAVFGTFSSPNFISRSMSATINACRTGVAPGPLGGPC